MTAPKCHKCHALLPVRSGRGRPRKWCDHCRKSGRNAADKVSKRRAYTPKRARYNTLFFHATQ